MKRQPLTHLFLLPAMCLALIAACHRNVKAEEENAEIHSEVNSAYYWKTVLRLDSAEKAFISRHEVERIYLRMFDVTADTEALNPDEAAVPNASVKVDYGQYLQLRDSLADMEFVPVVYVTIEALKAMKGREGVLAENIVTRVSNMCQYNGLPNVGELQLDCDWTPSTEKSYFALCDSVKSSLTRNQLPWRLSSTIRLHQLAGKEPPVDLGVLMVYNTGSFDNPDAVNSIIDINDIRPYLGRLSGYPLHLDVAYPTYSWQLLFRNRAFHGLANGIPLQDSTRFRRVGENSFEAVADVPHNNIIIRKGDLIREEKSGFPEVRAVKEEIEKRLKGRPHSNIIYHLDTKNLENYSNDEIEAVFHTDR